MQNFKQVITTLMVTYYAVLYLQYDALKSIEQTPDKTPIEAFNYTFPKGKAFRSVVIDEVTTFSINLINSKQDAIDFLKKYTDLYATSKNPISNNEIDRIIGSLNMQILVYDKYKQYDKTTYAKAVDITTISKARLRKINAYDPIGDIKVSNDVLDAIDDEIKLLYLH